MDPKGVAAPLHAHHVHVLGVATQSVLGCSYRLDRKKDRHGFWSYELRERPTGLKRRGAKKNP